MLTIILKDGSEVLAAELSTNIARYDFAIQIAKLASYEKRFHNDFNYPIISTPTMLMVVKFLKQLYFIYN